MNIIFKKWIVRRSYPNIHLCLVILRNLHLFWPTKRPKWLAMTDDWQLFATLWDLTLVELYLFHRYSGIGAIRGNWAWIPQITCRDTWKVIQSLQILILHELRPFSSVRALLWGEFYLFHRYSGIGAIWGNLAWIPQIMCRDTKSNPEFSVLHFTLNEVLLKRQANLRVELYLF